MRKTLTAIVFVLAAGSLAACTMPWDKEKDPPPVAVATDGETVTPNVTGATAGADTTTPVEQTASTDKPATPETPTTAPATK